MDKQTLYEEIFQEILDKLTTLPKDILFNVNIELLKELRILHFGTFLEDDSSDMTNSFYVVETPEKVTLVNEEFVIWITTKQTPEGSATYVIIALNNRPAPKLELIFKAAGIYNRSGIVIKVLNKLLDEIHESERTMNSYLRSL